MLKPINDLPPDVLGVILSFLQTYQFSYLNKSFKNQNIYVIVEVSIEVFKDLKNFGLGKTFEKFLQNYEITQIPAEKAQIFNKVSKHLYALLNIIDRESLIDIKYKYETLSFERTKIKEITSKVVFFIKKFNSKNFNKNTIKSAKFLKKIAEIHANQNQIPQAIPYYNNAISIFKILKKQREINICINKKTEIFHKMGDQKNTIKYSMATAKNLFQIGKKEKALEHYLSIIDFHENGHISESSTIAFVYKNVGVIYEKLNNIKAEIFFEKASKIFHKFNEEEEEAECYKNLALLYFKKVALENKKSSKFSKAKKSIEYFNKAYEIFEKKKNILEQARCKIEIGAILQKIEEHENALHSFRIAFRELLKIEVSGKNIKYYLANCCMQIAEILFSYKKAKKEALIFFKKALDNFCDLKIQKGIEKCFYSIKEKYKNIKNDNGETLAKCYEKIGDIYFIHKCYNSAANAHILAAKAFYQIENKLKAIKCCEHSIDSLTKIRTSCASNTKEKVIISLKNLEIFIKTGDIHLELGNKDSAVHYYREAANGFQRFNLNGSNNCNNFSVASNLCQKIAKIYEEEGHYQPASKFRRHAIYLKNQEKTSCIIL